VVHVFADRRANVMIRIMAQPGPLLRSRFHPASPLPS
jgi:hypothetical protein